MNKVPPADDLPIDHTVRAAGQASRTLSRDGVVEVGAVRERRIAAILAAPPRLQVQFHLKKAMFVLSDCRSDMAWQSRGAGP